ncbi:hypothetical protein T07_11067 [Trichinella nelsoni]|uniref:Uncharacterized protein n=1 Tax=Trichinella nelsoni TaxID=6336 RepID=A0A0V0RVJ8_9BILA|nr:hypothetical protein T07_11067 [Trichinella nelsoni]
MLSIISVLLNCRRSLPNCLNDLKLSDCNTQGLPLRAIKRLKACRSRRAVISDTTSSGTARVVIQNGPAMSKPVFSNGRVTLVRSEGSGAIFATNGFDSIRLQRGQAGMTFFTSRLPFKIQYRCLSVASVNSHPPCNCRRWHLRIIAVVVGCLSGKSIGCFVCSGKSEF